MVLGFKWVRVLRIRGVFKVQGLGLARGASKHQG